jgi:hypothetical protein
MIQVRARHILEGHGEPIGHHTLISTHGLNGNDVELEELDGVGGPIIMHFDVWPELVRPDHVALLTSKSEERGVGDELPSNLDVLASIADVVEGVVMIFSAALEGARASSGARWTVWQLGTLRGEDATQKTTFLA